MCEKHGIAYVSADWKERIYIGLRGGHRQYVNTDMVGDLSRAYIKDLVKRAASRVGLRPDQILWLHASCPCTSYSVI